MGGCRTRLATPIAGYIKGDVGSFVFLAREKLAKVNNIDEYMPGVEKTYLLANEADVVRASAQHLVYPINILLPELFPGINLRIVCNSEISETKESRFDMRWLLITPGKTVTAAILEYKTTRTLHGSEFLRGQFDASEAEKAMKEAKPSSTYFNGNAVPVSLQVSKYSNICKDVAVFDWSGMMLFDLNDWDPIRSRAGRGSFYTEPDDGGSFRLVLLGFLLQALGRHL